MSHFLFQIRKIEVGQDKGKPLFVEEVEICAADQEPVVFPLSSWVDDTEKDYLPGERQIIAPVTQSMCLRRISFRLVIQPLFGDELAFSPKD